MSSNLSFILSLLNLSLLWTHINVQIPAFIFLKIFRILLEVFEDIFDSFLNVLLDFSSVLLFNVNGLHIKLITHQAYIPAVFALLGICDLLAVIVIVIATPVII